MTPGWYEVTVTAWVVCWPRVGFIRNNQLKDKDYMSLSGSGTEERNRHARMAKGKDRKCGARLLE